MANDIRRSIVEFLANATEPQTTAQIMDVLQLRSVVGDIYLVLFPMQVHGLIERAETRPWTWSAANVGSKR